MDAQSIKIGITCFFVTLAMLFTGCTRSKADSADSPLAPADPFVRVASCTTSGLVTGAWQLVPDSTSAPREADLTYWNFCDTAVEQLSFHRVSFAHSITGQPIFEASFHVVPLQKSEGNLVFVGEHGETAPAYLTPTATGFSLTINIEGRNQTLNFQRLPTGVQFDALFTQAEQTRVKMDLRYRDQIRRQARLSNENRRDHDSSGYCNTDSGRVTLTLSDWKQVGDRHYESDPEGVFLTVTLPINPTLSIETVAPIQMSLSLSNQGNELLRETDLAKCEGGARRSSDLIEVKIECKEQDLVFHATCKPVGH